MTKPNGQTSISELLHLLGDRIDDSYQETFLLFSRQTLRPSEGLGFIDPKATNLEVDIGSKTFSITQSPGLLTSTNQTGTTGAVLWKITPLLASWLSWPKNPLRQCGVLNPTATVLELGCGISGLLGLTLAPEVGRYVLTDQAYVSKILHANLLANRSGSSTSKKTPTKPRRIKKTKSRSTTHDDEGDINSLIFHPLDWETDSVNSLLSSEIFRPRAKQNQNDKQINLLIACDCIYNEHLIYPFINTCASICSLNPSTSTVAEAEGEEHKPTILLIAQQLRQQDVFQTWLDTCLEKFDVWRVPDRYFSESEDLKEGSGFVVHVCLMKGSF